MELRQLRYFVAIAEEGSFLRAAVRLHVSQPPLSTQIKSLESELGVRLLERSNRGVTLTAAGAVFLGESQAMIARLEHAKMSAQRAGRGDVGVISIGFVSIADYGILPPALKSFRARYPLAEVRLHELTTDAQIRDIRAARLDLGIGLGPVQESGVEFEPLLEEELVLAAPSAHPAARGDGAINLRTLSKESFIVAPRDLAPGLFDLTMSRCRSAGFMPRITQHARQMQTVIGLVSCGMGFALVPSSVRNLKRPGVRYRRLLGKGGAIELGALTLADSESPLREHFIDALRVVARIGPASARQTSHRRRSERLLG